MDSKKEMAKEIFFAGVDCVMAKNFIKNGLEFDGKFLKIEKDIYDLKKYNNIYIFGSGKASINMAKAAKDLLKDRVKKSLVISNDIQEVKDLEIIISSHPLPSSKSLKAADRLIDEFESMDSDDFFIYLLSGGTSAMLERPICGISLEDFINTTDILLKNSLKIDEINRIRKALSDIKGGKLASKTKAKGVVLVMSDVIGDDLKSIGSAPLYQEDKKNSDIKLLLKKYKLFDKLPKNVIDALLLEKDNKIEAKNFPHYILASNKMALDCAKSKAQSFGLSAKIVTHSLEGDVKDVSKFIIDSLNDYKEDVLIFGGEPTVNVKGNGEGGRNQELVLQVLKDMNKENKFTFLSAGSDGIDGNSPSAGGVVEYSDKDSSIEDYLIRNDSYNYLKKRGLDISMGKSGTNVMDIMIAIKDQ